MEPRPPCSFEALLVCLFTLGPFKSRKSPAPIRNLAFIASIYWYVYVLVPQPAKIRTWSWFSFHVNVENSGPRAWWSFLGVIWIWLVNLNLLQRTDFFLLFGFGRRGLVSPFSISQMGSRNCLGFSLKLNVSGNIHTNTCAFHILQTPKWKYLTVDLFSYSLYDIKKGLWGGIDMTSQRVHC